MAKRAEEAFLSEGATGRLPFRYSRFAAQLQEWRSVRSDYRQGISSFKHIQRRVVECTF